MKRVVDVSVSFVALMLLSPVLLAPAVAILLRSGPPVLYRQVRIGLGGREFEIASSAAWCATRARAVRIARWSATRESHVSAPSCAAQHRRTASTAERS